VRSSQRKRGRGAAADAPPVDPDAVVLVESGVFDHEFYEAQVDETFDSPVAAAAHYLAHHSGYRSPHPLIDLTFFTEFFVERLKREARAKTLLDQLRRKSPDRALGPLFDARRLDDAARKAGRQHRGGVLGWFLEHHGEDAPLPGRKDLTLRTARPAMLAAAEQLMVERRLRRPRTRLSWPQAEEDDWRSRWADAPLPTSDGPLVSVVMPVRDRASVVGRAIRSLREQTLDAWELLVVDDGSTDDTLAVLRDLAAQDDRIRVIPQEPSGVCAARNRGLADATAPYVAFLDSDNAWRGDFLRLAVAAMAGEGFQAAYAAQSLTDPSATPEVRYRAHEGGLGDLMVTNHVDLNVLVVDTALAREVGGFDESLRRWVDHDFAIRLAQRTDLHLLPFIAVDYDDSMEIPDRITTREPESWQFVVLEKYWVRWDEVRARATERVPGRVSVVIPTWNDSRMTTRAVSALLRNTPGADLEVLVVDNGSKGNEALSLQASLLGRPGVRIERLPRNLNFAVGSNVGFARSTGETVVFLNNDTEARPGWLPPLLAALEDPTVLGAQPLLQYPDDSVQACGTAFAVDGFLPIHLFAGHPPEDAARMQDKRFRVVTAAALAMRAADVLDLEGFDAMFVNGMEDIDLCLRAAERRQGDFLVVTDSRITHHEGQSEGRGASIPVNRRIFMDRWRDRLPPAEPRRWHERGFEFAHVSGDGLVVQAPRPVVVRRPSPTVRWGLFNPAVGGEVGDLWGDTHFLGSLAAALTRLGQEPVSYRHGAHSSRATAYDDVALGVRGLDVIRPVPTKTNVLWVISHPEDVDPAELEGFDLVYAASPTWAAEMTARSGREVRTLLQATDADLRADLLSSVGDGSSPVFVGGNPKRRGRPAVDAAVEAGVPLRVHGPFWDGTLPDGVHAGEYVANHELMQLYRDHGLVLSDHWSDMGRHGFLSNRLFDAVASGARVVSQPIEGLELFEGAVQPFSDAEELAFLCSPEGRTRFPDDDTLADIADRVAREHSFDARAATLVSDVQEVRANR
jgi:glycosyltransferase involved in cell wall biosynthesis